MRLYKALVATVWMLSISTIFLLAVGIYCANLCAKQPAIVQPNVEETIYHCAYPDVDYSSIDAELDRITAEVPFIEVSDSDRYIVECVVAGEAGGHSYPLMKAVAQCMAVSMDMRGMTANEVRRDHGYHGYMPALEQTDPYAWAMVCSAVSEIFDEGNFVVYSPIEYFYNPSYGGGDFHEQKNFIIEIDGVRFFTDEEAD